MLISLKTILEAAKNGRYAVIAPDFLNTAMLRHYLSIAEASQTPIIASYPPLPIDGLRRFTRWTAHLRDLCEAATIPVVLHLDHGKSPDTCLNAIESGFSSVMIDASTHDLETNLHLTRQVVEAAQKAGVDVEAEIGHVGSNRRGIEGPTADGCLTDPAQAAFFANESGIDALAVSIGTRHGLYQGPPAIDFQRLKSIRNLVSVPLVLHGGSGTGDTNLRRAVAGGIHKINVFTDIINPYLKATGKGLNPFHQGKMGAFQHAAVDRILSHYFKVSGSWGKAGSWSSQSLFPRSEV